MWFFSKSKVVLVAIETWISMPKWKNRRKSDKISNSIWNQHFLAIRPDFRTFTGPADFGDRFCQKSNFFDLGFFSIRISDFSQFFRFWFFFRSHRKFPCRTRFPHFFRTFSALSLGFRCWPTFPHFFRTFARFPLLAEISDFFPHFFRTFSAFRPDSGFFRDPTRLFEFMYILRICCIFFDIFVNFPSLLPPKFGASSGKGAQYFFGFLFLGYLWVRILDLSLGTYARLIFGYVY